MSPVKEPNYFASEVLADRPEITLPGTGSVEQAILPIVQELDRRR